MILPFFIYLWKIFALSFASFFHFSTRWALAGVTLWISQTEMGAIAVIFTANVGHFLYSSILIRNVNIFFVNYCQLLKVVWILPQ